MHANFKYAPRSVHSPFSLTSASLLERSTDKECLCSPPQRGKNSRLKRNVKKKTTYTVTLMQKNVLSLRPSNSSWRLWKLNIDLIKCIFRRSANLVYRSYLEKNKTSENLPIFLVILMNWNFYKRLRKKFAIFQLTNSFHILRNFDMTACQSIQWNWSHFWTLFISLLQLF